MQSSYVRLRIPELRLKESGMTQESLAKEAGLSKATISNLESGRLKRIELNTIAKLCRAFACQPNDLFELPHSSEAEIALSQRQALKKVLGSVQYNKPLNADTLDKDLMEMIHKKISKARVIKRSKSK